MRHPRVKPDYKDTFVHVYNRVAGVPGDFPFGPAEKEHFINRLKRLDKFYTIDVVAYQVMSNHFHIILHVPTEIPSNEETAARYKEYYKGKGKRVLDPESEKCAEIAHRLRDISFFMHSLEHPFSSWFNRTRSVRRRGALWAGRFKNTVLESGKAVWDCLKYIEMNPVRAGMVEDAADYRFCSWGAWNATGKHPFEQGFVKHLVPSLSGLLHTEQSKDIMRQLSKDIAYMTAIEAKQSPDQLHAAVQKAGSKVAFTTRVDRRVRYWVDGLIIGSEIFVRETMAQARGRTHAAKRRLTPAVLIHSDTTKLTSYRQLSILME